jgi:hypothetical protein
LVGKPEQKRLLVRPKYRQEDSIKVFCEELTCKCVDKFQCSRMGPPIIGCFENGDNCWEFHSHKLLEHMNDYDLSKSDHVV